MLKQAFVINKTSGLSSNKNLYLTVKGSVLSIEKAQKANRKNVDTWFRTGQKKVTLQVKTQKEFETVIASCDRAKIQYIILSGSGEIIPQNISNESQALLIIGPEYENKVDKITNHLKLY